MIALSDGHDTIGKEIMLEIKTPTLREIQVVEKSENS